VNLGQVPLGGLSFKKVILSNTGATGITLSKIAMSTTGTGQVNDFSVVSLCPKVLASGGSCAIIVAYVPDSDDPLMTTSTAYVLITDTAAGSPQSVPLTAQTINPRPKLSEDELQFGGQKVGTTSNTQKVTLTNVGTSPLILGTVSITGDFALASGTTCGAGTSLNPSQSCAIVVDFAPTKTGSRYGQLTITDNALAEKLVIRLSGTGK
jgi:Abnormal spindle-like microcephaly-assoc'd, ASPM-SPD-2-Hydin